MEIEYARDTVEKITEDPLVRRLRVKLNMPVLVAHLSREEGRDMSEEEVLQWLRDAGFSQQDENYWIVSEADLGQVDPAEVLEVQPLN